MASNLYTARMLPHGIDVPQSLIAWVRDQTPAKADSLIKLEDDIWATRKPIGKHVDSTAMGHITFGCILVNDPEYRLFHNAWHCMLPVGAFYQLDGRSPHGTERAPGREDGLFAALIWDMPFDYSLAQFGAELAADPRFK